jgi:hypothetical protein
LGHFRTLLKIEISANSLLLRRENTRVETAPKMAEIPKEDKMRYVSDKDRYLWAFLSLKSSLALLDSLNEQILKNIEKIGLFELIKEDPRGFVEASSKHSEKLKRINERVDKEGLKNVYISLDGNDKFENIFFEYIAIKKAEVVIPNMSLVYIVAMFEDFLQKILKITFKNRPDALKTCQKSITYEDLLGCEDIEKAKNAIVEKELLIVNADIEDIKNYFLKKFNINVSEYCNWDDFKERFYRRNIIVHNSGMPNKLYREKTGYTGEQKQLDATKEYVKESIRLFLTMACQIAQSFEAKMS